MHRSRGDSEVFHELKSGVPETRVTEHLCGKVVSKHDIASRTFSQRLSIQSSTAMRLRSDLERFEGRQRISFARNRSHGTAENCLFERLPAVFVDLGLELF